MMIKEYLDYKKAVKIQYKINPLLPQEVECVLIRRCDGIRAFELRIQNKYGAVKELSRIENDIKDLIYMIFDASKRFHLSFTFHSHGLDYVYLDVEVK